MSLVWACLEIQRQYVTRQRGSATGRRRAMLFVVVIAGRRYTALNDKLCGGVSQNDAGRRSEGGIIVT